MTNFVPDQPEEFVTVDITVKELDLINRLRSYQFGKFTVHKAGGKLVRLESNESHLLSGKVS